MVRLWLRNEVFDGVLPLRAVGGGVPAPANHGSPQTTAGQASSPLLTLVRTLREVNPQQVRYTTWITEAWRVLQWSEPAAKLFWEMLALFSEQSERERRRRAAGTSAAAAIDRKPGQAAEMPISRLALFLFLHLTPDATMVKVGSSRSYVDAMWPSEEAPGASSPKRVAHSAAHGHHPAAVSPHSPSRLARGAAGPVAMAASGRSGPLSPTRTRAMRLLARSTDEAHRLTFVKKHLPQLLQLLSPKGLPPAPPGTPATPTPAPTATPPGGRGDAAAAAAAAAAAQETDFALTWSDIEALGFLIAGGSSLEEPNSSGLAQLCPLWNNSGAAASASADPGAGAAAAAAGGAAAGKAAGQQVVMASALKEWLAAALTINEHVYPVPPSPAAAFFAEQLEESSGTSEGLGLGASPPHPSPKRPVLGGHGSSLGAHGGAGVSEADFEDAPLLVNCVCRTTVVHSEDGPSPPSAAAGSRLNGIIGGGGGAGSGSGGGDAGGGSSNNADAAGSGGHGGAASGGGSGGGGSGGASAAVGGGAASAAAAAAPGGRCRDLQINHCHEAYVYVLAPVRFATVMGCSDCTIVIGAVGAVVRVVECERIQLVTCCRRISVGNCLDCVFSVFSASNPVLSGDTRACQFAPYNTCYPRLAQHLRAAGLPASSPPAVNLWNSPVDVSMMGTPASGGGHANNASAGASPGRRLARGTRRIEDSLSSGSALMPPEQFYTLTVPVPCPDDIDPQDVENPFALPSDYAAVLRDREAALLELQTAIRGGSLAPQQQRDVEEVVRDKFTEWLVTTGNLRQVLDLVHLERVVRPNHGGGSGGSGSWTAQPSTTSAGSGHAGAGQPSPQQFSAAASAAMPPPQQRPQKNGEPPQTRQPQGQMPMRAPTTPTRPAR